MFVFLTSSFATLCVLVFVEGSFSSISSNVSQSSKFHAKREIPQNSLDGYELPEGLKIWCNRQPIDALVSSLTKEKLEPNESDKVTLLISGLKKSRLHKQLKNIGATVFFLHVPSNSIESNIQKTFKNMLQLQPLNKMRTIIHDSDTTRVAEIFQYFTSIFGDVSFFHNSTSVAIDSDQNINPYEVTRKLKDIAIESNRKDVIDLVENFEVNPHETIFILNTKKNARKSLRSKINQLISRQIYGSFSGSHFGSVLSDHLKNLAKCSLVHLNQKILSDNWAKVARIKNYFSQGSAKASNISRLEYEKKIATRYNQLWYLSEELATVDNPNDFLELTLTLDQDDDANQEGDISPLIKNLEAYKILYELVPNHHPFHKTAWAWSQPIGNIRFENLNWLTRYHQKKEGGLLELRNIIKNCKIEGGEEKLRIKGNVVRLSDTKSHNCAKDVRFLEIFALEKVIIDVDLDKTGKQTQVTIIAPIWEVVDKRLIKLSGENGQAFSELRAENGAGKNKDGADGRAGSPGGPAGSFHGLAGTIINGGNLTVMADGGNGGPGQHGGHGARGEDGHTFVGSPKSFCELSGWKFDITVKGKKAGRGGNGGSGGVGGAGGIGGDVRIFEVSRSNSSGYEVLVSSKDGEQGDGGNGGDGGWSPQNGRDVVIGCTDDQRESVFEIQNSVNAMNGQNGKRASSLKMREMAGISITGQNLPRAVNEYKFYVRAHRAGLDFEQRDILSVFYDLLNAQNEIDKMYDTLNLVEEFTDLEKQYFLLNKQFDFKSSYEALYRRIIECEDYFRRGEVLGEYVNVIRDLIVEIEEKIENRFTREYYPVPRNLAIQFEFLERMSNLSYIDSERIMKIGDYFAYLKEPLDNNITKAQSMISRGLKNAINDLEITLENKIKYLLNDTTDSEEKPQTEKEESSKVDEKLQETIVLKMLSGVFKVCFKVLSLLNPALRIAGEVALSTTSMVDTNDLQPDVKMIPEVVQVVVDATREYMESADDLQHSIQARQKNFWSKKKSKIGNNSSLMDYLWYSSAQLLMDTSDGVSIRNEGSVLFEAYSQQEKMLTQLLQKAQEEEKKDSKKIAEIKIILETAKYLRVTSLVNVKNGQKIKRIVRAIEQKTEILEELFSYENKLYNLTRPLLRDVMENLGLRSKNIDIPDKNQLLLSKWDINGILRNVKSIMTEMMKTSVIVTEDIWWIYDKFVPTIDNLMEIHSQLLVIEGRKSNALLPTRLFIPHASFSLISDGHLRTSLARLQAVLSYNTVLESYDEWVYLFKQFAFPWAASTLRNLRFPEITGDKIIPYQISGMEENLKKLDKWLLEGYNKLVDRADIGLETTSASEWYLNISNSKDHEEEVRQILIGNETKIVVDIHGPETRNAFKFNHLELQFSSEDPGILEDLKHNLKNFKIKFTHHGDSRYKCDDSIYEIRNAPTVFENNFFEDSRVYRSDRTVERDFILSPYATWSIQLVTEVPANFKALERFRGKVGLQFVGRVQYLTNPDRYCGNNLKDYYTRVGEFAEEENKEKVPEKENKEVPKEGNEEGVLKEEDKEENKEQLFGEEKREDP